MQQDRAEKELRAKILSAEQDQQVDTDALWNKLEPMIGNKERKIAPMIFKVAAAILLITGITAAMQYVSPKKNETGVVQISTNNVIAPKQQTQERVSPQPNHEKRISRRVTRSAKQDDTTKEFPPEPLLAEDETYTQDPSTLGLYANSDDGAEDSENEQLITY